MSRFSVIIPFLGNARLFDATLASVLRHQPERSQIIIAHDGSYLDPYHLRTEVDIVSIHGRGNFTRLFNAALEVAQQPLVAVFRPGIEVDENWQLSIEEAFTDRSVASVSPIIVTVGCPDTVVAVGVDADYGLNRQLAGAGKKLSRRTLKSSAEKILGPTAWAAFYRRESLSLIGPLDETLDPHYTDLDIAMALRTLGLKTELAHRCVVEIESARLIARESRLPHGLSSQRALRRHADETFGRGLISAAKELLTCPVNGANFQHFLQRFGAGRFRRQDRKFADRLIAIANQAARAKSLGIEDATWETPVARKAA